MIKKMFLVAYLPIVFSAFFPLKLFASDFLPYADALATAGVIKKQAFDYQYRLQENITRAEMAKIAVNLAMIDKKSCEYGYFWDVKPALGDLCDYIITAADAGYISKENALFRPHDSVTRAEAVKMLLKAKNIAPVYESMGYQDVSPDALGDLSFYIYAAAEKGFIVSSDINPYFRPNDTSSRGEVFKIAWGKEITILSQETYAREPDIKAHAESLISKKESIWSGAQIEMFDVRFYAKWSSARIKSVSLLFSGTTENVQSISLEWEKSKILYGKPWAQDGEYNFYDDDGFAVYSEGPQFRVRVEPKDITKDLVLQLKPTAIEFLYQKNPESLQKKWFADAVFSKNFIQVPQKESSQITFSGTSAVASVQEIYTGSLAFSPLPNTLPQYYLGGSGGLIWWAQLIVSGQVSIKSMEISMQTTESLDYSQVVIFLDGRLVNWVVWKIKQSILLLEFTAPLSLTPGEHNFTVGALCSGKLSNNINPSLNLIFSAKKVVLSIKNESLVQNEEEERVVSSVFFYKEGSLTIIPASSWEITSRSVVSGDFVWVWEFFLKTDEKEAQEIVQLLISPYNTPESIVNFISDSFVVCESKIAVNPSINGTKILLPVSGLKIAKSQEQKCEIYLGIKKGITEGTQIKFALEKIVTRGEVSGSQKEISVSGVYTKNIYKYTQSKLFVSIPSSGISMPQSPQRQAEIFSFSASLVWEKNIQIQGFRVIVDGSWKRFWGTLTGFSVFLNNTEIAATIDQKQLADSALELEILFSQPTLLVSGEQKIFHFFADTQNIALANAWWGMNLWVSFVADVDRRIKGSYESDSLSFWVPDFLSSIQGPVIQY